MRLLQRIFEKHNENKYTESMQQLERLLIRPVLDSD